MLVKRVFDLVFSIIALSVAIPVILLAAIGAAIDTQSNGFFVQQRVGQHGRLFRILKLRTMSRQDQSISNYGRFLRRSKIDELPQLFNVLIGEMSIVGPRPDVPGYYDQLQGEARKILKLKPGLTSEASLKYYNEEEILAMQPDPLHYNDTIIFPDKVRLNLAYYHQHTLKTDLSIIWKTVTKLRG